MSVSFTSQFNLSFCFCLGLVGALGLVACSAESGCSGGACRAAPEAGSGVTDESVDDSTTDDSLSDDAPTDDETDDADDPDDTPSDDPMPDDDVSDDSSVDDSSLDDDVTTLPDDGTLDGSVVDAALEGGMTLIDGSVVEGGLDAGDAATDVDGSLPSCTDCDCTEHIECDPPWPVCAANRCVRCLDDSHLGCSGSTPLCKAGLTLDANVCVECLSAANCEGETPACQQNQCVPCSISDNAGCMGDTPLCLAGVTPEKNACVQCIDSDDCGGDTPVCENNQCIPCSTTDDTGCTDEESPRCFEGAVPEENTCVACLNADDCSDDRPLCVENACLECESNLECPESDASLCDPTGTCSGCAADEDCDHIQDANRCDTENGQCEECLENVHCPDPAAARCDDNSCGQCVTNEDCAHIDGRGVCGDDGVCVECTADDYSACDGGSFVCDTRPGQSQFTCSDEEPNGTGFCGECVSDTQCDGGKRCVMTRFGGVDTGYYCLWKEGATNEGAPSLCPSQGAPFVSRMVDATSVDRDFGTYCKLAYTTCQGFADVREQGCTQQTQADDCGVPGLADALCRPLDEDTNACTYQCLSNEDCRGTTCNVQTNPAHCTFEAPSEP